MMKIQLYGMPHEAFNDMTTRQPLHSDATYQSSGSLDDANCIVLRLDGKGRVISLNPFGLSFFGYAPSEIVGQHAVGTIVPHKDRTGSDLGAMIEDLLRRPDAYTHQINENRRKSGERVWVVWSNRAFYDAAGTITQILCVGNDITDRKVFETVLEESRLQLTTTIAEQNERLQSANTRLQEEVKARTRAQQELEESRDRYRLLSQAPTEGVLFHENGIAIEVNDTFADLVECPRDQLIGKDIVALFVSPEDVEQVRQNIAVNDVRGYEITGRTASGRTFPAELRTRPGEIGGRPCRVVTVRDITQRKKTERQLIQSQKMEAVGTLAGGIAHDFNNMLAGIQGNVELLHHKLAPDSPHQKRLAIISQIVERGAKLTGQLLGYARGGQTEQTEINVNFMVRETLEMFGRTQRRIAIHTHMDPDIPNVLGDRTQIEQVLLNLMINAVQAMPQGGDLFIETAATFLSRGESGLYEIVPGRYAMLSVRDTGHGMDADTRKQIFDPFFTTKARGQGTGLGLASTYGIVKNHKGYIEVYSEPEIGSQFNVLLPACASIGQADVAAENLPEKGTETILLVDDDPDFLDVGQHLLALLGYTVVTAVSGDEAVSQFSSRSEAIDLVIMDMIMPGATVDQTIGRLKEVDPHLRVLLSSGYGHDADAVCKLESGYQGFIQKPFRLVALSQMIRKILETPPDENP